MNKIESLGDWGSYSDSLDGKALVDGETIIVKWPDGFLEQISVTVDRRVGTVNDMGNEYDTLSHIAFYVTRHRGVRVLVPLIGIEAQRVNA